MVWLIFMGHCRIDFMKNPFYLCLSMFLMVGCSQKRNNDPVVARFDGRPIYQSNFSRTLMERLNKSPVQVQDTPELRRQVVRDLACRAVLADLARKAKLDSRAEFRKAMQAESTVVVLHGLWQEEIGQTLQPETIPEQELQDAFKKMATKFHVRHLFANSKSRIDSLYSRLQKGETFSSLARVCFRDANLQETAGDLGILSWGEFNDLHLEEAVFNMQVGHYSKPVESKYGWHILFLENLTYQPLLREQDYLVHKKSIQNLLWRRKLNQQSDERIRTLMQPKNIRMNVPLILELEKTQRKLANNGLIEFSDITQVADTPLENMLRDRPQAVLAFYDGGQWTVEDFRRTLTTVSPEILQRSLYRAVAVSLRNHFLLQSAQRKKIDQVPSVRQEIDDKRQHLLSAAYLAAFSDTCAFSEADLRQFYQQHRSRFLRDREMQVLEILLATEQEAYRLRTQIHDEKDFRRLARQYSRRAGVREKEGFLGVLRKGDRPPLGEQAFRLKVGAATSPVIAGPEGFSLLLVTAAEDLYAPFEQVKEEIRDSIRREKKAWAWRKLQTLHVPEEKLILEKACLEP